jgi:hypothetical protein
MITAEQAHDFAKQWINAWNSHDIDAIIEHYADDVEFHSPFIRLLNFNVGGTITNKTELKSYFQKGLTAYPDLQFQLHGVFTGTQSVVLYYTSVNGKLAAEVFELNDAGRASKVLCNYSN